MNLGYCKWSSYKITKVAYLFFLNQLKPCQGQKNIELINWVCNVCIPEQQSVAALIKLNKLIANKLMAFGTISKKDRKEIIK
jgi:hypothetical protein